MKQIAAEILWINFILSPPLSCVENGVVFSRSPSLHVLHHRLTGISYSVALNSYSVLSGNSAWEDSLFKNNPLKSLEFCWLLDVLELLILMSYLTEFSVKSLCGNLTRLFLHLCHLIHVNCSFPRKPVCFPNAELPINLKGRQSGVLNCQRWHNG